MTKLHAALLGITHPHSLAHMRTLQALPEIASISLWDEDQEALDAAVQAQGAKVVATHTHLAELLANPDIFFVIAAIRNDLGPEIFIRALEAGKHLMAEKPIGRTAGDTQRVIDIANAQGLQLGVCYQNRNNPVVQEARRLVQQGAIGELMSVEFRLLTTQVQFRNPQHWLFDHAKSGGGILSWLGCHYIDLMHYISGDEVISVAAEVATRSGEAIDVEDVAMLSLRFRSGAVGSFHAGYTLALSGSGYHNKSGYDTYAGFNGRGGRFYWSAPGAPTSLSLESTHPAHSSAPWRSSDYTLATSPAYGGVAGEAFIRRFIEAAQGDGEPMATGADALRIARIVDAAYESSRTGRRIELT
ncbi:MAG TPA: Gfo/Idh/MocA family oxidoreductase [Caldilineaceae bacterium]|nr:Gfo/Idh/MocA family oxidoreductase [Caldilineaceae bacterium]